MCTLPPIATRLRTLPRVRVGPLADIHTRTTPSASLRSLARAVPELPLGTEGHPLSIRCIKQCLKQRLGLRLALDAERYRLGLGRPDRRSGRGHSRGWRGRFALLTLEIGNGTRYHQPHG